MKGKRRKLRREEEVSEVTAKKHVRWLVDAAWYGPSRDKLTRRDRIRDDKSASWNGEHTREKGRTKLELHFALVCSSSQAAAAFASPCDASIGALGDGRGEVSSYSSSDEAAVLEKIP
jgi:hypothetical protein